MTEREQIRRVCQWNRDLARQNADLRRALQRSQEAAAKAGVERDTVVIFLDVAMEELPGGEGAVA
jgi:hypothetical protein